MYVYICIYNVCVCVCVYHSTRELRSSCEKINRSHTHRQRTTPPTPTHTHGKNNTPNPQTCEQEFVRQILTDPELSSRIDEFFWEHHVIHHPVQWVGWGGTQLEQETSHTMATSFGYFRELRRLGIRAHSWV